MIIKNLYSIIFKLLWIDDTQKEQYNHVLTSTLKSIPMTAIPSG